MHFFKNRIPAGTNLRDADFEGSDLTGVSIVNCDIRGANFKDCVIVNTNFAGYTWDETTIWPLGFDVIPDYFTILGDGTTYGTGETFETLKNDNKKYGFHGVIILVLMKVHTILVEIVMMELGMVLPI